MHRGFLEGKAMIRTRMQEQPLFNTVPNLPAMPLSGPPAIFRKQVSFEPNTTTIPAPLHFSNLSEEELRACWYSKRELAIGCREAKQTVALINSVNGDWSSIDHSKICIVGLEKFHGKKERDANKKLLIKSVLIRQEMNKNLGIIQETNGLKEISTMISASFNEYARWQAAMHMIHAHGSQLSSYATPPPPAKASVNCNDKRMRADVPKPKANTPPMNNVPKPLTETLEGGCTNAKRIRTCR